MNLRINSGFLQKPMLREALLNQYPFTPTLLPHKARNGLGCWNRPTYMHPKYLYTIFLQRYSKLKPHIPTTCRNIRLGQN
jgi:hypothetical protein